MKIGDRVKVANKDQINYTLEGVIIEKETSPVEKLEMSNVKFKWVNCWYADEDLEVVNEESYL